MEQKELKKKLKIAEEKLAKVGIRMGEAGGSGEWHDNSAWDNAVVDYKVREEIVKSLKEAIRKLGDCKNLLSSKLAFCSI